MEVSSMPKATSTTVNVSNHSNPAQGSKIFLIGMMGTGKSYWAKKIAKKLKIGGYDLDSLIEAKEEKSITEIFAENGEAYFRNVEAEVLRWFGQKKSFALATGGGTPCFNNNIQWMNSNGITIWIDEPVDVLVQRLEKEKAQRPLIHNLDITALQDYLAHKLFERETFYKQATYHLSGSEIDERNLIKIINLHA